MYAIVDVAGQQFKVEKGQKIFVNRLNINEGENLNIDQVLLIDNDGKILVGQPVIKGALVTAKVLDHPRADKIMVFKKKRRKGYQVKNGHRQDMTRLLIENVEEKASGKKETSKTGKKITAPKAEVKTSENIIETKPAAKKTVASKGTAKSTIPKKAVPVKKDAATTKSAAPKATTAKPATAKKTNKTQTTAKTAKAKTTVTTKKTADKTAPQKSPAKGAAKKEEQ